MQYDIVQKDFCLNLSVSHSYIQNSHMVSECIENNLYALFLCNLYFLTLSIVETKDLWHI